MDAEGVQGIVITEPGLDLVAEEEGNQAGSDTDEQGASGSNKPASGCYDHQAGNGPGAKAEHAGFAFKQPLRQWPDKGRNRSGEGRGGEGVCGHAVRGYGRTGIESVPAHP